MYIFFQRFIRFDLSAAVVSAAQLSFDKLCVCVLGVKLLSVSNFNIPKKSQIYYVKLFELE